MPAESAHNNWWQTSEVILGSPFLASIALQLLVPISLPVGFRWPLLISLGAALVVVGVTVIVLARREFAKFGQWTDPGHPTSKVVTSGVFSISRNPLYLGGVCALVGFALVFTLTWFLVLLLPTILACHYILIAPEERYLRAKFGEEYTHYAVLVHRWIGRSRMASKQ